MQLVVPTTPPTNCPLKFLAPDELKRWNDRRVEPTSVATGGWEKPAALGNGTASRRSIGDGNSGDGEKNGKQKRERKEERREGGRSLGWSEKTEESPGDDDANLPPPPLWKQKWFRAALGRAGPEGGRGPMTWP
uniref:Uncharacterized protein n=2 Tax=Physcomitrium patens TaxID=3218 RepID=A0A2K1JSY1_PHYPA|nr:hypothetical protein PHYPA_014408 [Physcomitrium patens]